MDTDARESRPAARNRAARSAALWATPLSILAGAVSVSWSAHQLRARAPSSPTSADSSPTSAKPPAAPADSPAGGPDPADTSRVGRFFKIWATPLSILVAAISLVWSVYQFNSQQHASQAQALDQQRQVTFDNYLDDMSSLLLADKLESAPSGGPVRAIAIARTDTAIRDLDGNRKGMLVRFLWEANLIKTPKPVVLLHQVNLRDADFGRANLQHADLSDNDLIGANFSAAQLDDADLSDTDLVRANLANANLTSANLQGANLSRADLLGALVTTSQLAQARSIQGTTLPNGSIGH